MEQVRKENDTLITPLYYRRINQNAISILYYPWNIIRYSNTMKIVLKHNW